ncbi:MAG TPA: PilZ domain-containing protein [Spirochaetia bacterium]
MGTEVGRIEKEFVFKSLVDSHAECDLHGTRREFRCVFAAADGERLTLVPVTGSLDGFSTGEEIRVFFYLKNNYHTFTAHVLELSPAQVVLEQPPGVYKNLQRKFERVKMKQSIDVSFSIHGTKVELNFPKSERFNPVEPLESDTFDPARIQEVVKAFRLKMETLASDTKIIMLRDKMPRSWEEKTLVRLGKSLWIPSTDEDFPSRDPFPDERVITKSELMKLEEEAGSQPYVITSKLGNILYEKTKADIVAELWCPLLYNEYVVGYVHVWNSSARRERIGKELVEYVQQFAKVLCYSLVANGYFEVEKGNERRYEGPIIDMSASGLLFAHTSPDLVRDLLVHTDLEVTIRIDKRTLTIGSRVMRKFRDAEYAYFGLLFLQIEQQDFEFLFQYLYGKPFDPSTEGRWEGGAPPPPLDIN